jgi:hypothetical protein
MQPQRKASHRRERLDAGAAGRGCSTWRDTLFSAVVVVITRAILRIGQEPDRETPRTAVTLKVLLQGAINAAAVETTVSIKRATHRGGTWACTLTSTLKRAS